VRDEAGFLRCDQCGDRIGVYEPTVFVGPDGESVPAEPDTDPPEAHRPLHRYCYEEFAG
jgi:hypothetical protein